jgi:hypothetical protein
MHASLVMTFLLSGLTNASTMSYILILKMLMNMPNSMFSAVYALLLLVILLSLGKEAAGLLYQASFLFIPRLLSLHC